MDDSGALGILAIVGIVAAVTLVGTGVYLYSTDYKAEATVKETHCGSGDVDVVTRLFALQHTVHDVGLQQCSLLKKGNFVEYHIRSKHTTLWEKEGGRCIWDTIQGAFCGSASNAGGLL